MDVFLNGFPKKLLIAISLVIVLTMCLMPTDARMVEHRRRHQRNISRPLNLTKETTMTKRPKQVTAVVYRKATDKIVRKLRNVRTFFAEDQKKLLESRQHENGNPDWLPKVNFFNLHHHVYTYNKNILIKELRFKYLAPKLYKSLKKYETLFDVLLNFTMKYYGDFNLDYKNKRWIEAMSDTARNLSLLITVVADQIHMTKMPLPKLDVEDDLTVELIKIGDSSQCLLYNYLAYRGYGNLLENWFAEFKCTRYQRNKNDHQFVPMAQQSHGSVCRQYSNRLNKRRSSKLEHSMLSSSRRKL